MDLPATQAIDEDFPATQQLETNDEAEDTVVGTLLVNNKSYPVHSGVTQLGRHPACKIVIDHETVSKKHAEIEAESADKTIFIRDLKSCNKTKINFSNLKPNFNYQIRDGDKLTFGQITATFKLFKTLDDSIVSCTPQVNRKIRPIIPGTPDSSMNASSASESDVSIIPGTQTDENFRRPQVPVRTSTSNEHRSPKLPAFILDDLPSPLKEKSKQEDFSEAETQRFSNNEINENQDSSIHSAQTQKTVNKTSDTDENIYEMETQRPYNPDEYKDNIENLQTQRCDDEISDITKRKSLDVSICSAETQKIASKSPIDQGLEYLETQRFDCRKSDSLKNKSMDLSIYSAETQKMVRESSLNENMKNLETQRFDCRESDSRKSKSMDVSIYSAETQKTKSETSQNIAIESLETQQYDPEKSVNFKLPITPKRYSKSLPISSGEKSLEDLETQPFIHEESEIRSSELRDEKLNESLENIETQPFEVGKCSGHEKSNLTRKSRISLHEAVTQEIIQEEMVDDLLDDLETQKFVDNKDSTIIDVPIEDLETQQVEPNKSIKLQTPSEKGTVNETLDKINTSKGCSDSTADQSIDDLETQEFVSENINAIIDESTENVESQQIDKSANMVSSLSTSVGSMETISSIKEKLPLDKDIQDPRELSFDSGFRTSEQESINSKTNSERSENQNTSNLQLEELNSSSHCVDESKEIDDSTEINNLENEKHSSEKNSVCSSSFQKFNLSEKVENIEKDENIDEDDDNEMYCSQALIEDCPFAFLPEESHIDNKSIHEITKSEKLETNANLNSSQNVKNANVNVDQESLQEKNLLIKSTDDDSETDEEGVFSSHGSKENEIKNCDKKSNESDSETDEEGIFSSHQSRENENNEPRVEIEYNSEIKKSDQPNNKSDSETDEEGVFSSRLSKDNENIELSDKNNKDNNEKSNNKDDENSETDEEGVFSNCLSNENKIDNSSAKNDVDVCKKVCDGDTVSDSETDEDIFTSNLPKKDSNKMSIKESDHVEEISKESSLSNRNNIDRQKSPTSDVDDIFDEHYDATKNSTENRKIESINEVSNKVSIDNDEVDELAPTQIIQPGASETEDVNLALALSETQNVSFTLADSESVNNSETIDTSKTKIHEIDDLALTQIVDSKGGPISEKEDEFLAPTQIVSVKKMRTPNKTHKDDSLVPTQIVSDKENLAEKSSEDYCDLDLAPTQKMPDTLDNESQVPTQVIDERIDINDKNASCEDLDYEMANTQLIDDRETEVSLTSSKRQLEEIEITSNKKIKTADISESVKIDLNNTVESNMDEIFEGPEDVSVKNNESALLTQQLANILESSQIEESLKPDMNSSIASPPLSNRRSYFKGKNRRRAMMLNRSGSQDKKSKPVINLNDTIERNLNEMFDNSINTVEAYESDTMLTQQLENVLESQDDNQLENEDSKSIKKSSNLTISTGSKKHRLSLSSNLNTSSISKNNSEKQSSKSFSVQLVDKNETTSQESNSKEEESQGTEEYFANLKSKKKRNIFEDSQSDNETILESSSSTGKVSYRRGTIGFREDGKSVSTKERVGLVEIKGRSLTSDSQSDGEDVFGCTLAKTGGKKRVSLSLSKHVNLNASMSSLSDQEPVEKKVHIEQQRQKQEPNRKSQATTSEKSGNDDPKLRRKSSVPVVSVKRVQAPGTLGFTDNLDPVEGEELASAASTTSEDERQTKQEKVCNTNLNSNIANDEATKTEPTTIENDDADSDDADSDEELLRIMPAIKVAGTAECPPTNSQLAAPSDDERESSPDIVIPAKWHYYAEKRFDRIYNMYDAKKQTDKDDKIRTGQFVEVSESSSKPSVDEVLARIEASGKSACKKESKKAKLKSNSNANVVTTQRNSQRPTRNRRSTRTSNSFLDNSPKLDVQVVKHNPDKSFSKLAMSEGDSDSDIEIVPKYEPLEPMSFNINAMLHKPRVNRDDDSDQEFAELRKKCEQMLAVPSVYTDPSVMLRTNKKQPKASPQFKSRRRKNKSALSKNYNSVNIRRSKSDDRVDVQNGRTKLKPRDADEDALVFQVSAGGPETTQTTRMSGLTIIRHKRSAAAEDSQNQPSKRSKPDDEIDRIKLQELAQPSVDMPAPVQKRVVRAPKTLDGYVVLQKSAKKEDSSDQSAVDCSIVENKSISASRSRATRGKANTNKKKNNANSSTGSQDNNSSKENVEMEDSDNEGCGNTRPSRIIRGGVPPEKHTTTQITDALTKKDAKVDSSSISRSSGSSKENLNIEDSEDKIRCKLSRKRGMNKTVNNTEATEKNSTDEILGSFEDVGTKRTEGRTTRQKKAVPVQEHSKSNQKATIIKDSDSEQDEESKIVDKRNIKSRRIKDSDSGKSDKTSSSIENDSSKSSKGKGTRRNQKKEILEKDKVEPEQAIVIQDSDVEQSQKSNFISKEPRNKRLKNLKSSDSDKSEITGSESENSRPTRGRNTRRNQKEDVPAKELQIPKKESSVIVNDSDSEDSEFVISRNIRTKDIKNSKPVKSNKSQVVEESIENKSINTTSTRASRRNQKQEIPVKVLSKSKNETSEVQDSDLEVSEFVKKDYEISRIEETKSSDSQKSDVSSSTGTRSRRGKARNESSDSVYSGSDNDKKKSTSSTNTSSRPARQTRKRAAPSEVSVAEIDSSTESQEVADILKNAEKNIEQSRTRGRRRNVVKESVISSSEDTQDSETNNSNDVFEKPVSRAKRARVTKNTKIKSASQPDLDESTDSKLKLLQKSAASRKKKSPSPTPIQATLTPTRNRRSISSVSPMKGTSYKVLFTGDKAKAHRKTVTKLGGSEVEDLTKCSILVTHEVVRTLKFLCSLAKGIPIVSVNWLEDSNKAGRFLDWEDYILHDPAAEKKYNFTLKESLEKAKNHKLLDGYNVLLTSHRALPPVAELKEMVISSGGKPLLRAPAKWPENTIVIAKEENLQNAKKLIAKAPKSVTIYSVELILTGILRQDINLQEYRLLD